MPLYEYRCDACGRGFDARRPVEYRQLARCACGVPAAKRASAPPVVWSKFQGATHRERVRKDLTSRIEKGPR